MISTVNESLIVCRNSQGEELRAGLLRLLRHSAVFEVYSSSVVLRMSELLNEFRVVIDDQVAYSGQALVSSVVNTGTRTVCEARLDEAGLRLTPLSSSVKSGVSLREPFGEFVQHWQKYARVLPEFKDVIGDMECFLTELRLWLEQVELEIRSTPSGDRQQLEKEVIDELTEPIVRGIDAFIERFERIAEAMEPDLQPVHRAYLRRQLHPLILCSPFAYRAHHKPLGFAGDYELVDMMVRAPYEGGTLYAKMINVWLLGQAPARAHRNRVEYLAQNLSSETQRAKQCGHVARVYNLGCGPAAEIQQFLRNQVPGQHAQFTLVDFNEETLVHGRKLLERLSQPRGRSTGLHFVKRSVQQILKDASRSLSRSAENQYDLVYCAGLFDYLSDAICKRLIEYLYELVAPGGLLIGTNVSDVMNRSRPFRHSMEYILDWHLIYRSGPQVAALAPEAAPAENCRVIAEETGVNVFLEVRKPGHG